MAKKKDLLDIEDYIKQYGIEPKGVVLIGAYDGREYETYKSIGFRNMMFVEADPEHFAGIAKKYVNDNIELVNVAVNDMQGEIVFHKSVFGQSNSILPMKKHLVLYPSVYNEKEIVVKADTIDNILNGKNEMYNVISIDIQGAELKAFHGAVNTLKHIDMIHCEVNFVEMYEGCGLVGDVDNFLVKYGFKRVETVVARIKGHNEPAWGDAIYVNCNNIKI